MSDNASDPDRIESDLDRTRARLGSHLNELQERLSPGQVVDDLMTYFRGSEGADFGRNLLDSVRANPVPAALAGIGIAWLMASNPRPQPSTVSASTSLPRARDRVRVFPATASAVTPAATGSSSEAGFGTRDYDLLTTRVRSAEQGVVRGQGEAEHSYRDRLNEARGQAVGLARHAQETAESFAQRIQDALSAAAGAASHGVSAATHAVVRGAHDLRDSAGEMIGQAGGAVQQAGQQVAGGLAHGGHAAGQMGGNLVSALTQSPVLLGVVGLAAGAVLGALVPQSEQEEAALGGVAGQARDTARNLAQEAMDRGGHVVQAVVKAGRESASEHGLSGATSLGGVVEAARSGDLAGNAAQVARDVIQAADDAVRNEGLGQGNQAPRPRA